MRDSRKNRWAIAAATGAIAVAAPFVVSSQAHAATSGLTTVDVHVASVSTAAGALTLGDTFTAAVYALPDGLNGPIDKYGPIDGPPVAGLTVTFSFAANSLYPGHGIGAPEETVCTAVTNASGVATCKSSLSEALTLAVDTAATPAVFEVESAPTTTYAEGGGSGAANLLGLPVASPLGPNT